MNYDLSLPDHVLNQLAEIADWYERKSGSMQIAIKWQSGFLEALEDMTENPESFALVQEIDPEFKNTRQLLYGSGKHKTHRALFRIVENTVEVLSVRHLSRRDVTPDDIA